MKLLVADDELSTRIFLKRSAAKWGYEVVEATNGLEAMELLRGENPPRIAVLDWMMPGLDGVEICARLQEKPNKQMTYTILLTCKSEKEDVMYALDQGAHDFLSKPVHVGELRSRIAVGKRLIDANDRLLELDLLKDRFMGIAAHDLRNPLGYILATSEMLMDRRFVEVRENQDEYLRTMGETAERMLTLVNDLLDVSVIRSGYLKVDKQPGSITVALLESIQLQQHAAASKNMRIIRKFAMVPEFSFDASRIGQVVDNLLSNAIKFSSPGSEITISVAEEKEKNQVLVTVDDQGPGLTKEDRNHLFGEFQRLSARPTGDEKSIGLGLTIARKIVEVHGGTIFADSPASGGSRFGFTLPLQDQAE